MPICGCGKQVFFGRTTDGKTVLLDSVAPVYRFESSLNADEHESQVVERDITAYVSHSALCHESSDYLKRKLKEMEERIKN